MSTQIWRSSHIEISQYGCLGGRCCGGMALSANVELANRLSSQKAAKILATGAQAVVTNCPNCQDMIHKAVRRSRHRTPVYLVEDILGMALMET